MGTVPKFVLFQRKSKGHECIKSTSWVELNTASDVPHAEESCLQVLQRTTPVSTGFAKSLGPSCRSNNWKPGLERDCNCGGCVQHTYWHAYLDWQPMPQLLDYWLLGRNQQIKCKLMNMSMPVLPPLKKASKARSFNIDVRVVACCRWATAVRHLQTQVFYAGKTRRTGLHMEQQPVAQILVSGPMSFPQFSLTSWEGAG